MKKVLLSLSFVAFSVTSFAQSGSLSPYGMYGIGSLSSQANSAERSMAGVGQAFREGNEVNFLNPASYANVDSLTFLFDVGMSLDRTFFKEGSLSTVKNTGNFEYLMAGFRVWKHVGVGFGILPVSSLNFNVTSSSPLNGFISYPYTEVQNQVTTTNSYYGSGGIREAFVGVGWEPIKGLSIGANAMYTWGSLLRTLSLYYSDTNIKQLLKIWDEDVHKFRFNVGAQYTQNFGKTNSATIGVTYTPKCQLGNGANKMLINYSSADADTTNFVADKGYYIPEEISAGLAFRHGKNWRVGVDYSLQRWSNIPNSTYVEIKGTRTEGSTGSYNDRHRIAIGGEWCKNPMGRSYFSRIRVRAGFSYSTSYLKLNVLDSTTGLVKSCNGPEEISATIGAGIPIINGYNNRSVLNIGFQWVRESGSLIKENTLRINVGFTFNERWFAKWKFE